MRDSSILTMKSAGNFFFCVLTFFASIIKSYLLAPMTTDLSSSQIPVDIITPGFFSVDGSPSLWQSQPVFSAGLELLSERYPRFKWRYQPVSDPMVKVCGDLPENVQFLLGRWYYTHRTTNVTSLPVIVAFGCEDSAEMNAMASAWDVLLITALHFQPNMDNRQLYPTYLATSELTPSLTILYCNLLRTMNWSKFYILFDRDSFQYYHGRDKTMLQSLRDVCPMTLQVTRSEFARTRHNDSFIISKLKEFNAGNRVMMFFGDSRGLRKVMTLAAQCNMTQGEHVYLAVLPFESNMFGDTVLWQPSSTDDESIHQAYQAVVLVRLVDESRYKTPDMQKIIQKWLANPGPDKDLQNKLPNLVSLHIAIELAGIAINRTYTPEMREKGLLPSGTALANSLLNRTFQLALGPTPMMASAQVGHRQLVSSYSLKAREYRVFLESSSDPATDTYDWHRVLGGQWFGTVDFPPDEPYCGFDGKADVCQTFAQRDRPIGIAVGCLFVLCLSVIVLLKMRQAHALHDIWWIVLASDLAVTKKKSSVIFLYNQRR